MKTSDGRFTPLTKLEVTDNLLTTGQAIHGPEVLVSTAAQAFRCPLNYGECENERTCLYPGRCSGRSTARTLREDSTASRETAGEFAGHTPGPWIAKATASLGPQYAVYAEGDRNDIATVYDHGPAQANAELIAAAPTLLAERDSLRDQLEEMQRASERHDRLAWEQRDQLRAQLDAATDALRQRTEQRDRALAACKEAAWVIERQAELPKDEPWPDADWKIAMVALDKLRAALAAQGGAK